ncbi:hypothetical protein [Methanospirillum sp.]|uniref:hypothetical protein n=1 Tax=Methanospirillum sp. TaxID=45200 RepID=UPI002CAD5814|nr:hypothetical protein [Methanospirillum sp.]HPP77708.1 hypothetical protein [Methanospirillum sp.]
MRIQAFFSVLCILFLFGTLVSGGNQSAQTNNTTVNQTESTLAPVISPQENLMNYAFEARAFALEKGKETALAEFSNPAGQFARDGKIIRAYDTDGVLLADCTRPGDIGSRFITDDHDAGQIRQMRDLANTGGGLYVDAATGNYWFVADIDGSWWICAALA